MLKGILLSVVLLASVSTLAYAREDGSVFGINADFAGVLHDHVRWPDPETVANDLHSANDETRIKALKLVGFSEEQVHRLVWSQGSDAHVTGTQVPRPDEITLSFAALGDSTTQGAILSVFIQDLQTAQLAVAVPIAGGWTRIAVVSCWCKYEADTGIDLFAGVERARGSSSGGPQVFELVIRASGGGSALYDQTESHFRIHDGELKQVLSFTSRYRMCDPTDPAVTCSLERRWFYPTQLKSRPGGILVRAFAKYPERSETKAWWSVRDLEIGKLQQARCASLLWDQKEFSYKEIKGEENPCIALAP